jgi:phytanoyl-CoA hydroxylase
MQLTQQQLDDYSEQGWLVVEEVFSASEAGNIAELALSASRKRQLEHARHSLTDAIDYDSAGMPVPRKLSHPFLTDEVFRNFALDNRLQSLVSQLLGKPALLVADQIFMKPPRIGSGKPWHQDNAYFQCFPANEVLTAWIALDDADESNGCLHYIDGSHRSPLLKHEPLADEPHNRTPAADQIDTQRISCAAVARGGVVFHHSQTLHSSAPNESGRWRRAHATHWATADVTSSINTIDNAYYNTAPELYSQAANT